MNGLILVDGTSRADVRIKEENKSRIDIIHLARLFANMVHKDILDY